jgi:hypothetical protein
VSIPYSLGLLIEGVTQTTRERGLWLSWYLLYDVEGYGEPDIMKLLSFA